MHGITEKYLSGQKADAAGFVRCLLDDLECKISMQFSKVHFSFDFFPSFPGLVIFFFLGGGWRWRLSTVSLPDHQLLITLLLQFVDEACHQIERIEKNVRPFGVLPYIPSTHGAVHPRAVQRLGRPSLYKICRPLIRSPPLIYCLLHSDCNGRKKKVSIMFVTLERVAQTEPKYTDVVLLENYAAFQNSLYDLANVVPTLAKFYHQASESYEQACTRHITSVIYLVFDKLFQFGRRIEDLMYSIQPEEIPFQMGLSKMDLRKVLKASLPGMDKSIGIMYRRLQKNLTSEDLLPSLWDKCKKDFLEKYEGFVALVAKVYPNESMPSVAEMKDLLASL
ncbi:Exocyst complex component [Nymphaea thermarum]|nr:Exocyst complex component [Nymphaea thermarum]